MTELELIDFIKLHKYDKSFLQFYKEHYNENENIMQTISILETELLLAETQQLREENEKLRTRIDKLRQHTEKTTG